MSEHAQNQPSENMQTAQSRPLVAVFVLFGGLVALLLGIAASISVGSSDISLNTVWEAIFHFRMGVAEHHIVQELRLPRTLGAVLVGAGFAVAGAMMQGMTRNPLADSGLLGINAGASVALALCFSLLPKLPFEWLMISAFIGAGIGAGLVFGIGSLARGGLTPVRLILAGAAVSALLIAVSEGIAIYFRVGQNLAFWFAGGVSATTWSQLQLLAPWVGIALLGAFVLSRSITLLSLGEEIAVGLGQKTRTVKLVGAIIVLMLAGSSVAIVGAVGFVGLIIPHVTRYLVGVDYRWIIPCSAVLGGLFVVLADIGARMINPPYEVPIGALIALIGVPFFLYLARRERRELQ